MAGFNVAVVNATALLTDEQVSEGVAQIWACMRQGHGPEWAAGARLVFVPRGSVLPPSAWALVIMDDVAEARSLVNAESMAAALA